MVHDVSSWFVMFCHGSCFVMVRDVSLSENFKMVVVPGSSMVRDVFTVMVSSWFVMVHVMVRDVSLSWFRHGS